MIILRLDLPSNTKSYPSSTIIISAFWLSSSGPKRPERITPTIFFTKFSSLDELTQAAIFYSLHFFKREYRLAILHIYFYFLNHHTIRKVKFLSKNSILTKPQHFHEFFTPNFLDNFSREIKVVNS